MSDIAFNPGVGSGYPGPIDRTGQAAASTSRSSISSASENQNTNPGDRIDIGDIKSTHLVIELGGQPHLQTALLQRFALERCGQVGAARRRHSRVTANNARPSRVPPRGGGLQDTADTVTARHGHEVPHRMAGDNYVHCP